MKGGREGEGRGGRRGEWVKGGRGEEDGGIQHSYT